MTFATVRTLFAACSLLLLTTSAFAQPAPATQPSFVKPLTWRSIGPASMGGRITDLAVLDSDPSTFWVATASGGLLKTTNNGTTFEHQFERETTVSIGAVAVAQSNAKIVWVGTGENNPRNSVSFGDGVYKSVDGGKTWKNMGLKNSFQIGKILIHPKDPNTVYIGALGRLYGSNEERGLYKTTDGGENWHRVLFIDDKTGVIDMAMSPADPNIILAATWERQRDGFDSDLSDTVRDGYNRYDPVKKWGPGAGIWRTTDGGKSFNRVTKGLPTSNMGRIGFDFYRKTPGTVFAIIDCEKIGMGPPPKSQTGPIAYAGFAGEEAEGRVRITTISNDSPAQKAGLQSGDILQSLDDKPLTRFEQFVEAVRERKVGDKLKLKILHADKVQPIELTLGQRPGTSETPPGPAAAYIGLSGDDASAGGARLTLITRDGPAAKAGLKVGDILQRVGDKPLKQYRELTEILRLHKPGDVVKVAIERGGDKMEIPVTLAARPAQAAGGDFGPGGATKTRPYAGNYGGQSENQQDQQGPQGYEYGGVYKSTDGGETWTRINSINPRPMYFSVVRVDPSDEKNLYVLGVTQHQSHDAGKTFTANFGRDVHADGHALWIDPRDGRHMILGCDGGFYATYDRGENWDFLNTTAIGQFYHVDVSPRMPYWVAGGLQDNGCWAGPGHNPRGAGPINEDWLSVAGGDGYVCRFDPSDPDLIYYEAQNGSMGRRNMRTGERAGIAPRAPEGAPPYRFNWNTPYILSKHNPKIFYCGGNYVFRSLNRGDNLQIISPEITATKWGSATAVAESPKNPDVLYAGTDDGALWITRDGGKSWSDITKNVGLVGLRWVATIEPSRYQEGRVYVAFDGHRSDDDDPLLFVSEDFGQTWKPLRANLPRGSTRVLREDIASPDLLFCGTEFAAWCSLDRGKSWAKLNTNLPTVAVHEFAFHPTCGEVVIATHGRSLWALDVSPLRQIKPADFAQKPALYQPLPAIRWQAEPVRGRTNRRFAAVNPPRGASIYYSLPKKAATINLQILDIEGQIVREFQAPNEPGLNKIPWDLVKAAPSPRPPATQPTTRPATRPTTLATTAPTTRPSTTTTSARPPRRGAPGAGQPAAPGAYRLLLTVDGVELSKVIEVQMDPNLPPGITPADESEFGDGDDDEEEEEEREREREREMDRAREKQQADLL